MVPRGSTTSLHIGFCKSCIQTSTLLGIGILSLPLKAGSKLDQTQEREGRSGAHKRAAGGSRSVGALEGALLCAMQELCIVASGEHKDCSISSIDEIAAQCVS